MWPIHRTDQLYIGLIGAIVCMGIATANSVLLVSFAREGLSQGLDAATAALEAGFTRFRPVVISAEIRHAATIGLRAATGPSA